MTVGAGPRTDAGERFDEQVRHLVDLGYPALAGTDADAFTDLFRPLRESVVGAGVQEPFVLVPSRDLVPVPAAMAAATWHGREGFVVEDLGDLSAFVPIDGLDVPDGPGYVVTGVDRGDRYLDVSPDDALPAILARGRTPLTVDEGVAVLTQLPDLLERNRCFMTIGSRCGDRRVPAVWVSNGTGRDGRERRCAPKVGWCWAGNRHTWLGHASALARVG